MHDYASYIPECPPAFKKYLERHVFPACKEADKIEQLELYLCNPEILDFGLGVEFMEEASQYTIWNYWFQGPEESHVIPFHPIPDNYKPWPKETEKTMKAAYIADDPTQAVSEGVNEKKLDADKVGKTMSNLPPGPFASLPGILGADDGGDNMFGDLFQQMKELEKHRLYDMFGPSTTTLTEGGDKINEPDLVDRTGPDWTVDSEYLGFRQPPLAVRLEHVKNLLCEEDMYRDLNWAEKFAETKRYLEWLAQEDPKDQLLNASTATQQMWYDAMAKVKVHEVYDHYNSQPTPLVIDPPPKGVLKSTRLNWLGDIHNWPIPTTDPVPDKRDLMPIPTHPRPVEPVNTALIDEPDTYELFEEFKIDQRELWQDEETEDNLAVVESEAFLKFSGSKFAGWVRHDPTTDTKVLADDTIIIPSDPRSFARERGARRAGLQQMLRVYHTTMPDSMVNPLRTLQLPIDTAVLHKITQHTDGVQFVPVRIPEERIQKQADTMPFTVQVPKYLESLKHIRERALKRVEALRRQDRRWVTLPRNVVTGGPFVWRMVDPDVQLKQDILSQCNITYSLLATASRRAPRLLLSEVVAMIERGIAGEFHNHDVPAEIHLHSDELETIGGTTAPRQAPRYVDLEEDIPWLKFLASEAVNDGNYEPNSFYPSQPAEKYKLFHIFAKRVQKLLDDRDPDSLFADADAQVTVEQLLARINAGREGAAVDKVVFHPYDAMAWLDRLADTGHVRFQLDPSVYGVVMRPLNKYFPENRVIWPGPTAHREKPGFKLGYISTWQQILCPGVDRSQELLDPQDQRYNFFLALAFRLGYTIYMLNQERAEPHAIQPVPGEYLTESITTFEAEVQTEMKQAADKEDGGMTSLAQLIQKLSPRDYTGEKMSESEAFGVVRKKMLEESISNLTMLVPGRETTYYGRDSQTGEVKPVTVRKRDVSWEFAAPRLASASSTGSKKPFQYWRLDRWPLGVGYTSEETERKIKEGREGFVDPRMVWDPVQDDPISERYMRPKLRRFGEDEKVKYKRGPAFYPIGDTVRQAWRVEESMTESAYRGMFSFIFFFFFLYTFFFISPFHPSLFPFLRTPSPVFLFCLLFTCTNKQPPKNSPRSPPPLLLRSIQTQTHLVPSHRHPPQSLFQG